jgi:hypothetical protein
VIAIAIALGAVWAGQLLWLAVELVREWAR